MDTAVVLGALVPSWSAAVVLVSYLTAAGAVLPGVQPDRASPPSDLSHLREARRQSGCSLRAERHVHWYERMQPESAAQGDASASSSSSPSAAAWRPEVPLPRRLLPPSLLSSLPPSSHSSARALSSTAVPHLQYSYKSKPEYFHGASLEQQDMQRLGEGRLEQSVQFSWRTIDDDQLDVRAAASTSSPGPPAPPARPHRSISLPKESGAGDYRLLGVE